MIMAATVAALFVLYFLWTMSFQCRDSLRATMNGNANIVTKIIALPFWAILEVICIVFLVLGVVSFVYLISQGLARIARPARD